mmetsp:Transcript_22238/g.33985  ORF Transcript_22238/g.33985 Transcript_22238/m.33985 type:complete len:386 (-) Transcript_22238:216-1373(-)
MILRSGAVSEVDSDSVRDSSNTCTVEVSSASSAAHMFASSVAASSPPPSSSSSSSVMEDISEAKISIRPWRHSDVDWPPQLLRAPDSPESSLVMVPSISNKIRSMRVGARASTIFFRFDFNLQQCFNNTSAGQAGLLKNASLDGFRRFALLPPPVLDLLFLHMISSRRILFKISLTSSSIHRNNIPKHLPAPASATILVMANSFSSSIFSFSSPSTSSDTTSSVASPSTPASRYVTTIGGNEVTDASLLYPPFGSLASLVFPDAPPPPPPVLMFILKFMPIPKLIPIFKPMLLAILLALPPAFPLPPPPLLSNTCLRHRTCWTTRTFSPMSIILPATSSSKSSALSPICKSFAICCLRSDMRGSLLSLLAMLLAEEEDTAADLLF